MPVLAGEDAPEEGNFRCQKCSLADKIVYVVAAVFTLGDAAAFVQSYFMAL